MQILVLHPGALGDLILSFPALRALRRAFPAAQITLAANRDFAHPVAGGQVDQVLSFSTAPLHRLYLDDVSGEEDVRFWRGFDRIVSWTGAGHRLFERNLRSLGNAVLIARWQPHPGETRHVSQIFLESLEPWLGAGLRVEEPCLQLREQDRLAGADWLARQGWHEAQPLLAIHPGAGSEAKRRPLIAYRRLAQKWLDRTGGSVFAIEGPAEPGLASEMAGRLPGGRVLVAAQLPLGIVAGALARCRAYAGNDSGISHLAAALGVSSRVFFGPTDPTLWRPLGRRVRVVGARPRKRDRVERLGSG